MADKNRYPQIPATVWWGVRTLLHRTPNVVLDDRTLSVHLSVQPVAAKQYIAELKSVGLINEDGKATPLALKWRLDNKYTEAVKELMDQVYPESLRNVAADGIGDRDKVTSWFQQEGLGFGAARNKAATYALLGSPTPGESPSKPASGRSETKLSPTKTAAKKTSSGSSTSSGGSKPDRGARPDSMPLNVNVQIHISADAGSEQIESIFSAMRRYLNDAKGD